MRGCRIAILAQEVRSGRLSSALLGFVALALRPGEGC